MTSAMAASPAASAAPRSGGRALLLALSSGFPHRLRGVAVGLLLLTAVVWSVAMFSAIFLPYGTPAREWLHPDWEYTLPAFYSAALLLAAAVAGFVAGRSTLSYRLLALGLLGMAIDEVAVVHETLEVALGIDWQLLYLPLILGGLVVIFAAHRRMRAEVHAAALLVAAGVACWFVSQVLELIQWDGDTPRAGYGYMMGIEEGLEMVGTVAFLLAFLVVLAARADRPAPVTGRGGGSGPTPRRVRPLHRGR